MIMPECGDEVKSENGQVKRCCTGKRVTPCLICLASITSHINLRWPPIPHDDTSRTNRHVHVNFATTMSQTSPLLRLPRELRDQIFEHLFDNEQQRRIDFDRMHNVEEATVTRPLESLHPISRVSQQLYIEAIPSYLSCVTPISFNVATTCWLRKWLATIPPSGLGYRSIRQLAFRSFHGPEQIKGYELMAMCPNLQFLNIMLGDEYSEAGDVPSLAISSLTSFANEYDSLDNIILMHQLHRLLDLPKLEVLEFGFHDWAQPVSCNRARQVKEWLKSKFQAKGREVYVVCKQMQWGGSLPDEL
jgi:hypothetical protein